jgi:hypothetical protein
MEYFRKGGDAYVCRQNLIEFVSKFSLKKDILCNERVSSNDKRNALSLLIL